MMALLLFSFALSAADRIQEEMYANLLGTWDVQTEDGQYALVFTFSMEEEGLKGIFSGPSGEVPMTDIAYENNELIFTCTIDTGGGSMILDVSAKIEGESLSGIVAVEFGEANIRGTKRK